MDHGNASSVVGPVIAPKDHDPEKPPLIQAVLSPRIDEELALPNDGKLKEVGPMQANEESSDDEVSANKIPRAERRGLFAALCLLSEVDEPRNYPRRTKWMITFIIACAASTASLGSAIILRTRLLNCSKQDPDLDIYV